MPCTEPSLVAATINFSVSIFARAYSTSTLSEVARSCIGHVRGIIFKSLGDFSYTAPELVCKKIGGTLCFFAISRRFRAPITLDSKTLTRSPARVAEVVGVAVCTK